MGYESSKTVTDNNISSIVNSISQAMIQTTQNCQIGQNLIQNISVGNIEDSTNINFSTNAEQVAQTACVLTASSNVNFQSNITNAINATVAAAAKAKAGFGVAQAESYVKNVENLVTNITNALNVETLQSCLTAQFAQSNISVQNIKNSDKISITITSSQNAVAQCVQNQTTVFNAVNELAQNMTSNLSNSSSAEGASLLDLFGPFLLIGLVILIAFLVLPASVVKSILGVFGSIFKGIGNGFKSAYRAVVPAKTKTPPQYAPLQ